MPNAKAKIVIYTSFQVRTYNISGPLGYYLSLKKCLQKCFYAAWYITLNKRMYKVSSPPVQRFKTTGVVHESELVYRLVVYARWCLKPKWWNVQAFGSTCTRFQDHLGIIWAWVSVYRNVSILHDIWSQIWGCTRFQVHLYNVSRPQV